LPPVSRCNTTAATKKRSSSSGTPISPNAAENARTIPGLKLVPAGRSHRENDSSGNHADSFPCSGIPVKIDADVIPCALGASLVSMRVKLFRRSLVGAIQYAGTPIARKHVLPVSAPARTRSTPPILQPRAYEPTPHSSR